MVSASSLPQCRARASGPDGVKSVRAILARAAGRVAEWQTRTVQVRVSVRTWGFNSPLAHVTRDDPVRRKRGRGRSFFLPRGRAPRTRVPGAWGWVGCGLVSGRFASLAGWATAWASLRSPASLAVGFASLARFAGGWLRFARSLRSRLASLRSLASLAVGFASLAPPRCAVPLPGSLGSLAVWLRFARPAPLPVRSWAGYGICRVAVVVLLVLSGSGMRLMSSAWATRTWVPSVACQVLPVGPPSAV
jgi:hypothetical protein